MEVAAVLDAQDLDEVTRVAITDTLGARAAA